MDKDQRMVEVDLAEEKDFNDHPSVPVIQKANENISFQFRPITVGKVTTELKILNINKVSVWDMLLPLVLIIRSLQSPEKLSLSITKLYNSRIEQSTWSTKWKKGDNRQERINYRSITVLPVIGKVFESYSFCHSSSLRPFLGNLSYKSIVKIL